jgi:glycerophosphoryl diester phosphodiesterase
MLNVNTLTRRTFDSVNRPQSKVLPFVESHRGCHKEEPENTLAAFRKAIEYGCDSIELDIWLTKDLIPVVIHSTEDGNINETTDGNGIVNEMTLRELSGFKAGRDEPIPTLESVLMMCKNKIFMNIEIKDKKVIETFNKIVELLDNYEMHSQIAISSFHHLYYDEIKKYNNARKIEFGFLWEDDCCLQSILNDPSNNCTLNIWQGLVTHDFVKCAHERGMGVLVWFKMLDDENDDIYENLFKYGVDVICSNYPHKVISARQRYYNK